MPNFSNFKRRLLSLCLWLAAGSSSWAQSPGTVLWTFETGDVIQSSPALAPDGTIYFGSHDGRLYAVNPDGSKKWAFRTLGNIPSSPVVAKDGTIYIASLDKMLYALTPEGRIKWMISPGSAIAATPALGAGGDIYVATAFNRLCAIHPAGSKKWDFNAGGNLVSSPLVNGQGLVCFGCQDGKLYAVKPDGSVEWAFTAGDKINSSPALGADETLYFGAFDGKLHAIHPDGSSKWEYETGNAIRSSPAIGLDGAIFIGSDDGKLHAVSPEGKLRWTYPTSGEVRSSPAVGADGVIYFGSYDNTFHAVSANGAGRWKIAAEDSVTASPVIDANGVVYFGSWDKKLYAVKCSSLGLARTSWPMFRGDAQHAGKIADGQTAATRLQLTHLDARIPLSAPAIIRLFASSGAGDADLEQVDFFQGTNKVGEAASAPFTLIQTNIAAGVYSYRARAKFTSGKTAQSPAVTVTVKSPPATRPKAPTIVNRPPPPEKPTMTPDGKKPSVESPANKPRPKADPVRPSVEITSRGAGDYNGIIHSTSIISHDTIGFISIRVEDDGAYQGELSLAGRFHSLRGKFDKSGTATRRIARGKDKPLNVSLKLDFKNKPDVLTGTVSNGLNTSDILADRRVYDGKSLQAPEAGRYTLTMTGEAKDASQYFGEGFGTLVVDEKGVIRFEGLLGDGTELEQKAHVSPTGVWSFYVPLYRNAGCVVGWIRFKDQPFGDLFGQLTWIRPSGASDPKLAGGFTAELSVIGSRYSPPPRGRSILNADAGILALRGDGFSDKTFINAISIEDNNRVVFPDQTPLKCKLRLNASTGLFSGSFVHPSTGKTASIQGALLQKQRSGAGFFRGPNRTGPVAISSDAPAP